ncbi:MAG TPA: RICIN domain-containing protein [Actinophytocola sp.]|uniref:alpha-galactosidase n=1 Tax=Actinophytocola sp. TaxID=1872138 RepID=UPI002DDCA4E9|nr:RICIN domain-containing protein [Actinophytocola sp.]HEV2779415.1 RICIN domain-containing protein [Actinophytocola sp.]
MSGRRVLGLVMVLALLLAGLVGPDDRPARAWNNGVASTPPMGWNSYDSFNWSVTEADVRANADYLRDNLRRFGWQYIVVDWAWYYPGRHNGSPNQDVNLQPRLRMDGNGRLLPDTTRFPSAAGGNGFRPLADYVHAQGLKFGVHLMRGIPRQAVADNVPILGTGCRANQINNNTTAAWLNLMWGLNMSNPCAQAYLDSVFQLLASWGVDYVKVDDIAAPTYRQAEVEGYRRAIERSGRPMVLSLSPGPTPLGSGPHVAANAHMWRTVNDLWDNWPSVDALFAVLRDWTPYRSTGAWPDPDMIPIGRLAKFGPVGSPRYSNLTADEQRTLMTLWSITRSPLMWGGNPVENRAPELALMANAAVLAVDQASTDNRQLTGGNRPVWTADVPGSDHKYLALFNRDGAAGPVSVNLADLGIGSATVTDLWSGADLGTVSGTLTRAIPAHGAGLYRLAPQSTVPPPARYTLTARHSGKLLDVFNAATTDDANIVQWTANGQTNQQWQLRDAGGGFVNVVSVNSGKCLDVAGSATTDGARIVQWTCHTGANQQWRIQDLGTGYLQLIARHSGKCLDVLNAAATDGAQVVQWTCGTGANQQWQRRQVG